MEPPFDARINVMGLLNLLECCRLHGTQRVVYVSSGGVVYGEPDVIPTPETFPKLPLSPYAVTKLTGGVLPELTTGHPRHGVRGAAYSTSTAPAGSPRGAVLWPSSSTPTPPGGGLTIFGEGAQTGTTSMWVTWWRRICWPPRW